MTSTTRSTNARVNASARPLLAAGLLLAAACGGDRGAERDGAPQQQGPASGAAPGTAPGTAPGAAAVQAPAADGDCRMSGAWQRCSAVESVERAGYRLELLRDSVEQRGLPVRGAAYRLGSAELQLFLFPDGAAAERAAAAVDADDAEPAETRGILRAPAVIRSNNLVALLFDNNDRLRERVELALAAGLPPG